MSKKLFITVLCLTWFLFTGYPALAAEQIYIVKPGDSLWLISQAHGTTVEELKRANRLTSDNLAIGQKLVLASPPVTSRNAIRPTSPAVNSTSSISWIIPQATTPQESQANTTQQDSQPVPQVSSVELVDWFTSGKYMFKSGEHFTVTDCGTGKQLTLKVLSAGNHCDIEPATAADTKIMQDLFGQWTWSPRPVIIHKNGKNIAGSLSGQPHDIDTTPDNGVNGHFDLYLHNSKPHGSGVSQSYVQEHLATVAKAAGN
ncbi:LysM peptidoglycan-binding domain-containing protein [Desulforamulus ferrireducens]|uniref:LysM domain-containing protein n=1 Tax=Desulforamulus ferrireducens TaxID=1833852 RepID=A0A1S6IVM2_9FIRM|nr:LysM peptidoglycan-binding domain-containing protein [Desulforamulus ferrireducens]AQS58828.1 hypothetical protein B0537_06870 [Desulforamulus ferrireducens]